MSDAETESTMVSTKHLLKTQPMGIFAKVNRLFQRADSRINMHGRQDKLKDTCKIKLNKITKLHTFWSVLADFDIPVMNIIKMSTGTQTSF